MVSFTDDMIPTEAIQWSDCSALTGDKNIIYITDNQH